MLSLLNYLLHCFTDNFLNLNSVHRKVFFNIVLNFLNALVQKFLPKYDDVPTIDSRQFSKWLLLNCLFNLFYLKRIWERFFVGWFERRFFTELFSEKKMFITLLLLHMVSVLVTFQMVSCFLPKLITRFFHRRPLWKHNTCRLVLRVQISAHLFCFLRIMVLPSFATKTYDVSFCVFSLLLILEKSHIFVFLKFTRKRFVCWLI